MISYKKREPDCDARYTNKKKEKEKGSSQAEYLPSLLFLYILFFFGGGGGVVLVVVREREFDVSSTYKIPSGGGRFGVDLSLFVRGADILCV